MTIKPRDEVTAADIGGDFFHSLRK
jgi:hypothetical protein